MTEQELTLNWYCRSIKHYLCESVYGYITLDRLDSQDKIIVTIERKGFNYRYEITDFTRKFMTVPSTDVAKEVVDHYRKTVVHWFIK